MNAIPHEFRSNGFTNWMIDVQCQEFELQFNSRSWASSGFEIRVESFQFEQPPAWMIPGKESNRSGQRDSANSGKARQKEKAASSSNRTRIQPSKDIIRVQDRLFYLLQPPLENVLANRELEFRFEPFPYQYEGIAFLYPRQFGVLADEMGLGKTMQAISTIRLLLHAREISNVLLICPKPLATNWISEFKTWAPEIPIEIIKGDRSRRSLQWFDRRIPVKVANYELLLRDQDFFDDADLHFDLVVLDEAQRVKNSKSSTSKVVKSISRSRNWALTGTPIENSLDDLTGIFDFLSEGFLPPGMQPKKIASEIDGYILRRTKDEVLDDMPPKIIQDVQLDLSESQWETYKRAEEEGVIRLNQLGAELTVQHVFELVLRLKQICNADPSTGESTKIDQLKSDLEEVAASGRKAIVFSQWVKSIEQIADELSDFRPLQYHGKVPSSKRDAILDEFKNSVDRPVILMSYGTGSVGLNLQFCRYVFLFDRWWNPAIEDQAINRAHRLGSVGSVYVKRFICTSTIEERIHAVLEEKRDLFHSVLGQTMNRPGGGLNQDDIFGLFQLTVPKRNAA